jgi:hypothetical protein
LYFYDLFLNLLPLLPHSGSIDSLSPSHFSCCNTPKWLLTVRCTNNSTNEKHVLWCLPTLYTITLQSKTHWMHTSNIFPEKPHY